MRYSICMFTMPSIITARQNRLSRSNPPSFANRATSAESSLPPPNPHKTFSSLALSLPQQTHRMYASPCIKAGPPATVSEHKHTRETPPAVTYTHPHLWDLAARPAMLVAICALQQSSMHVCVRRCYSSSEGKLTISRPPTFIPGRSLAGTHTQLSTHSSRSTARIATQPSTSRLYTTRVHVLRHRSSKQSDYTQTTRSLPTTCNTSPSPMHLSHAIALAI